MKQKTVVVNLVLAFFGFALTLLFILIVNGSSAFEPLAFLMASGFMLVTGAGIWSVAAVNKIKRQTVPIQDFFDNTVHELTEESVRFLVITVCCWFAPAPSLFDLEVKWVSIFTICICVATFTVVRPLARVVTGVIAVWKTLKEKKEEAK